MKKIGYLGLMLFLFSAACASSTTSHLEKAQFELDNGNYNAAISQATQALQNEPSNARAARLLASAYFGRSGMDYLDLAEAIIDLGTDDQSNFQVIANALPDTADLDDLRSAIETIESITGYDAATIADETLADAVFDLGIMQIIEHFALGVYGSDYFSTLDVTNITQTQSTTAQADLISFDNRLIASGVDSTESFLADIRQTFCILEPISAGEGFTLAEYQALVACQLSDNPDAFDTTALTADIANCGALNPDSQNATVTACFDTDTAL